MLEFGLLSGWLPGIHSISSAEFQFFLISAPIASGRDEVQAWNFNYSTWPGRGVLNGEMCRRAMYNAVFRGLSCHLCEFWNT